jgi:hypothetical protein
VVRHDVDEHDFWPEKVDGWISSGKGRQYPSWIVEL